jgi:hypothetical protein
MILFLLRTIKKFGTYEVTENYPALLIWAITLSISLKVMDWIFLKL